MDTATTFTAAQWMSISDTKAREVFAGNPATIRSIYRKLAQQWHPDRNADAQAESVFIRIQHLYRLARGRPLASLPLEVEVCNHEGRTFRYSADHVEAFELGRAYRAHHTLAWMVSAPNRDLFDNAVSIIEGLGYVDDKMKKSISPLLPTLVGKPWGADGGLLVMRRDPELIRLRDLMSYLGAPMEAKHVAWIISCLFNLVCYLEVRKLAHHGITLDNIWINPAKHSVSLLGGWFYACPFGAKMIALPAAAASLASSKTLTEKLAAPGLDRELVRAVGRELLGDRNGQRLEAMGVAAPLRTFLKGASSASAIEDYRAWKLALTATFGPPTFVPMPLCAAEVYQEKYHG